MMRATSPAQGKSGATSPAQARAAGPEQAMISATGLRKSFGDHVVLDGVDLHVAAGTIFALLGPNGAGKTTIVQILSTLLAADGGELRVAGHDPAARARRGARRDRRHRPVLGRRQPADRAART